VTELELIGMSNRGQRYQRQRRAEANFHDEVHPNHPYELFCGYGF
jgi:hypothetical protein